MYGDDVYFLQVQASRAIRAEGLWSRLAPGEPPRVNLVAVVEDE